MYDKSLTKRVADLTDIKKKVTQTSFNAVIQRCTDNIIHMARYGKDDFILFTVPPFILGHPVYDRNECLQYLHRYIERMKMQACIVPNTFTLCVAWNVHIDVKKIVTESAAVKRLVFTSDYGTRAPCDSPAEAGHIAAGTRRPRPMPKRVAALERQPKHDRQRKERVKPREPPLRFIDMEVPYGLFETLTNKKQLTIRHD